MSDYGRVKVVVAGDSGVGKTAFVHLLCHGEPLLNPSWTIGCSVEMTVFPRLQGDSQQSRDPKRHFVELWDIGGSACHSISRGVFYENPHGLLLVYDLTNTKSENHLHRWLAEVLSDQRDQPQIVCHSGESRSTTTSTTSLLGSKSPPVLVVGCKLDQTIHGRSGDGGGLGRLPLHAPKTGGFALANNLPEIRLDCNSSNSLMVGGQNSMMVSDFLQQMHNSVQRGVEDLQTTTVYGSRYGDVSYRSPNY